MRLPRSVVVVVVVTGDVVGVGVGVGFVAALFWASLPSWILRFLAAGSAGGCDADVAVEVEVEVWVRIYVQMSPKRVVCVGFWAWGRLSTLPSSYFFLF